VTFVPDRGEPEDVIADRVWAAVEPLLPRRT
jgi:hypothetical protein